MTVPISVLMPVYNANEDEFRYAIESILNQTFSDFEFIIVNDGSTNNTEEVVLSYNDPRIKYIKNEENLKIISTLNKGLDVAQGKYVARLDSDDYSVPHRLEREYNYLEKNPNIGVVGSYFLRIPQNVVVTMPNFPNDVKLYTRYCQNCILHSTVMLRKSVLDEHNLRYDKTSLHAEDHRLWSEMSRFCDLAIIPEVLVHYRISPGGISETNTEWQRKMVTLILMENMIRDFDCDKKYLASVLTKYVKNEPVTEEEFNTMGYHIGKVLRYVTERVSYPYNMRAKNFMLSCLRGFVREGN